MKNLCCKRRKIYIYFACLFIIIFELQFILFNFFFFMINMRMTICRNALNEGSQCLTNSGYMFANCFVFVFFFLLTFLGIELQNNENIFPIHFSHLGISLFSFPFFLFHFFLYLFYTHLLFSWLFPYPAHLISALHVSYFAMILSYSVALVYLLVNDHFCAYLLFYT